MPQARRKICIVVTSRASYARIRSALDAIVSHPRLELQLVVAASAVLARYGSVVDCIRADGFHIDSQVYMVIEGENPVTSAKSTGLGLSDLATVFDQLRPDVVVSIADRYETLATSIAASYMNIPLAHIQGGEVTGSIDEKVRHANTKLADLHFVATRRARRFVIRMGEDPACVFRTGCPSIDLAAKVLRGATLDGGAARGVRGVGRPVDLTGDYLVVLQHPVTTQYDQARAQATETLRAMATLRMPVLWFWPNADAGSDGTSNAIRHYREGAHAEPMYFVKHVDSMKFLRLLLDSRAIVGNSSVAIREASFLGVPAVNLGERQRGRERGRNVIDVPHDRRAIVDAVRRQCDHGRYPPDRLYGEGDAGTQIADHLATAALTIDKQISYVDDRARVQRPARRRQAVLAGG